LIQITRPDGQVLWLTYNPASGKLASLVLPTGTYNYQYSPTTGKLSTVIAPDNNQLVYGYDGPLLKDITWSGTVTGSVSRSYNADFNITEQKVNGTEPVAFQYDKDQLLTQAGNLALAYDAHNGLLTGTALDSLTDNYRYNSFGEVTNYQAQYATSELYKTAYTRDKLGRITQKVETAGGNSHTYDYSYDSAGRLVKVEQDGTATARYGYDDNGNRTTVNGAVIAHYDDQDRLLDYRNASYEYTANGELKTKTVNGTLTRYDYDVLGNLKQVSFANSTVIDYLTDGQNRRIGKKVNGVLTQGWLYQDGLRPLAELDGNNLVVSRFIYASKSNVPDYLIKGGATYRIVSDHLGSPRLIVNIADDTVAQAIDYDVWGKVISDSNPGFQPFGFAGGLYDPDTKLVRFGARDYDAQTGRWTAKDPIEFDGGDSNIYAYVGGNPVNFIDPFGLYVVYEGPDKEISRLKKAYKKVRSTNKGKELCEKLENSADKYTITNKSDNPALIGDRATYSPYFKTIVVDPSYRPILNTEKGPQAAATTILLGHELGHAATEIGDTGQGRMDNVNANENPIRQELNYPNRTTYP
jgi:RHS repeat-associated protein